ncbi:hypothetical protein CcrC1_gp187 [Caulobacter phage C1]|nr:hypothetical protein CcrC1_gp187 [Caulobacter phage C1]UTU08416.1 hypothetical protein CcrC2_gp188 [Caulobacter phage C2]UTU08933.1 hypothetical protein CcrJ4_gp182 [Caulobacter phage J4]UTU09489.1 hypothetical protein CcrBL47_gp203 [Caulobacter phage BL47]UTU10049.1 hypothetical protein CcrRB23_gp187 [Caulobacter phage RB23]WGN97084.1 hypothetical protein [Bertelyvirus sp.]
MIWWLLGGAAAVGLLWWLVRLGAGLALLELVGEIAEALADGLGNLSFD